MSRTLSNDESSRGALVGPALGRKDTRRSSAPTGRTHMLSRVFTSLALQHPDPGETPDELRGPLGLDALAIPAEPIVDFVFVHGLGGGSRISWSSRPELAFFWPKHWLPRDPEFRQVRIHSFGYDADWHESRTSFLDVHDFGNKLLTALHLSSWIRRDAGLPIVFVAHSMGGLVVKQAYILSQSDPTYRSLGDRFHTMFFLGTPHHGAPSAELLSTVLKATAHGHRPFVDDLHVDSPAIQRINESFRHIANKVRLFSFFEVKAHPYGVKNKSLVVSKHSAVMGLPNERNTSLDTDHRGLNKFDTPDDPNYTTIRNALVETLDVVKQNWDLSNREQARNHKRRLRAFLGLTHDLAEQDLNELDEPRAEGSCEWIADTLAFRRWRDESGSHVMGLFARPAMGKSYIAGYVREHLEALGRPCASFFFKASEAARSSLRLCLVLLAYNMACHVPAIRDAFLEMQDDDVHIEHNQEKPRHIWQKLFVNGILKQTFYQTFYWVIDALDECKEIEELLQLMSGIDSTFPLRIFVTSRPSYELSTQLLRLRPPAEIMDILPENNLQDIKRYVDANTSFLDNEQPKLRDQLVQKVLTLSEGCFLWVKLVIKEIKQVQSSKTIQRILEQMPPDMDQLYIQILDEMSGASHHSKPLIKAILRWTVCSIRPLTVDELKHALMRDIDDEIHNLEHQIPILCRNLLFVDAHQRVRLVHQTARTFLLDPENLSEFAVSPKDSHHRIAAVCLEYLSSNDLRAPRAHRPSHQRPSRSPFLPYAATCFYEHLRCCSTKDEHILHLLCRFLRNANKNILSWIEYIATINEPSHLIKAGMTLATYLKRRAKHFPALGEDIKAVEAWSIDLIRLVTKFGHNLTRAPGSIFTIIPPFCPTTSAPYKLYGTLPSGISVSGLFATDWDDRLASLSLQDVMLSCVACSPSHFAIGASDKHVRLYNAWTCQSLGQLSHAEPLRVLEFNVSGQLLLSAGRQYARVWDVTARECLKVVHLPRPCIAATFTEDSEAILLVCLDNKIYKHQLSRAGSPSVEQLYAEPAHSKIPSRPPDTASFSREHKLLAFVYRGGHINIWNCEENVFEGVCEKPDANTQTLPFHATSLVFNPQPESDTLAAAYEDGLIIIFHPFSGEIKATFKSDAGAPTLACSVDGRTLISGDASGTIRAFDFETFEKKKLKLLHIIRGRADNIRSLAFCDNLRFVDIRESQSHVWEPAVLIRQEKDDEISDTVSIESQEHEVPLTADKDEITCIDHDPEAKVIFAGTEAGVVKVYDIETERQCQILYTHKIPVVQILYNHHTQTLISADSASRVFARKLSCHNGTWSVQSALLRKGGHRMAEPVEGLIMSPDRSRVLIVTTTQDDSCLLDGSKVHSAKWDTRNRGIWITRPANPSELLLITSGGVRIFSWDKLQQTSAKSIGLDVDVPPDFDLKAVLTGWGGRILITEHSDSIRVRSMTQFLLWDLTTLDPSTLSIEPCTKLHDFGHILAFLIGTQGTMIDVLEENDTAKPGSIIFVNRDGWVCSVDMQDSLPQSYRRHFFFPNDWLSTNDQVLIRCTPKKEIVFVKEDEIAIIRGGLEHFELVPFVAET